MTATLPHPEHPFQELRTLSRNHLWRALTIAGLAHASLIALALERVADPKPARPPIIVDYFRVHTERPPIFGGGRVPRGPNAPKTRVIVPNTPIEPVKSLTEDSLRFADPVDRFSGANDDSSGGRTDGWEITFTDESNGLYDAPPPPEEYIPFEEAPRTITPIRPAYPRLAIEAGVEGTVLLLAFVGKDGAVKEVRVVRGIPMLDRAAIDAVEKAAFRPALQNSNPVAVWVSVPVVFRIRR